MRVADVVRGFTSFWNDTIPFCDAVVTEINKRLCASFASPLQSTTSKNRHALVNEVGFELFRASLGIAGGVRVMVRRSVELDHVMASVRERLARFTGAEPSPCSSVEVQDAVELAVRLETFFAPRAGLKTRLPLAGCGWLPECEADVWADCTLYEIKAGDRPFRGIDIRQLLVYSALNSESRQYELERLCLVNPRHGKYYDVGLDDLCVRAAGTGRYEVINGIINLLGNGGTSP
jgi:hypothetical protein